MVGKIIHLRQHHHFGPMKIQMYLERYRGITTSTSGIWRILKRLEMNRLPAAKARRHPLDALREAAPWPPGPGRSEVHRAHHDQGGRRKKYHQHTAIDDRTRLRILRIYPEHDPRTAIEFMDYVLARLPFKVEKVQTDSWAEFQPALH